MQDSFAPIAPLSPSRRALLGCAVTLPALALSAPPALAQFRVEVSGAGSSQIPFSAVTFRDNGTLSDDIAAIVRADLERSGLFRFVAPLPVAHDEMSRPDFNAWRQKTADALLTGSVSRLADGRVDVRFRAWDTVKGQELGAMQYVVPQRQMRNVAHKIADYLYERLTGDKGVFSTRIAYVTKQGSQHRLMIADADGEGSVAAFTSSEPIISPSWAPGGSQVAYVSFESRKPVIYSHDIFSRQRRMLANFRGSNSAPSWSPDGSQLVATLSLSGNSQIYAMASGGSSPRRLTNSGSIDTEPVFSADGRSIYFVSDRAGSPQIYRMDAQGGGAQRITTSGTYNISPSPSPDGRLLAFISRIGGAFRLHVMDLSSGSVSALTETSADESPSFAPNSRLIVYATREGGRDALMTTTVDGRVKTRLASSQGDIREPDWGPFAA